jgi:hypothetical protein
MPKSDASRAGKLVRVDGSAPHFKRPATLALTPEPHFLDLTNAISSPGLSSEGRLVARIVAGSLSRWADMDVIGDGADVTQPANEDRLARRS